MSVNEEYMYWRVDYTNCEGYHRWGIARTDINTDADYVLDHIPMGWMGDEPSKIISIDQTYLDDDATISWDLVDDNSR